MVALYTLASLMGALLLFLIQPMFAKMTLPLLGGTPAIWNTAMVFYQVVLLLGYAYAHYSTRLISVKKQSLLHILVLVCAAIFLPISLSEGLAPDTGSTPAAWLLGIYTISIGLPFFALSAMSPMLQKWFSQTNHPQASNPYFLYAASNAGSMFALLAYPSLIEPTFGLGNQGVIWSYVYGIFIVVVIGCVVALRRHPSFTVEKTEEYLAVTSLQRLKWTALAFIPSSLLLSVTTHMTTDLASAPFLWVLPLSIFLLTFVIVFSRKPLIKHVWMVKSQAMLMLMFAFIFYFVFPDFRVNVFIHLLIFFVSAMVCHGELAASKPDSRNLTEFYLFMSIGGALGGIFTGIIAPAIFNSIYEYPIGLVLACLARPMLAEGRKGLLRNDFILPIVLGLLFYGISRFVIFSDFDAKTNLIILAGSYIIYALFTFSFSTRPIRYGVSIAILIFFGSSVNNYFFPRLDSHRSFFAVHTIFGDKENKYVFLKHGTTTHGIQSTDKALWKEPFSYYTRNGPAGQLFSSLKTTSQVDTVGLVGLGLGALTCYREPDQAWKIFEIDPVVVEIANDTKYFHYMEQCGADIPVVLGDARLSLVDEPSGYFDVLVLDAFSSDAIPIHLLTQEAIDLYIDKLSERGILLVHISNRFLNLAPVFARYIENRQYPARSQLYPGDPEKDWEDGKSHWLAISKSKSALLDNTDNRLWTDLPGDKSVDLWTDDFSNLWQVIIWPE